MLYIFKLYDEKQMGEGRYEYRRMFMGQFND